MKKIMGSVGRSFIIVGFLLAVFAATGTHGIDKVGLLFFVAWGDMIVSAILGYRREGLNLTRRKRQDFAV